MSRRRASPLTYSIGSPQASMFRIFTVAFSGTYPFSGPLASGNTSPNAGSAYACGLLPIQLVCWMWISVHGADSRRPPHERPDTAELCAERETTLDTPIWAPVPLASVPSSVVSVPAVIGSATAVPSWFATSIAVFASACCSLNDLLAVLPQRAPEDGELAALSEERLLSIALPPAPSMPLLPTPRTTPITDDVTFKTAKRLSTLMEPLLAETMELMVEPSCVTPAESGWNMPTTDVSAFSDSCTASCFSVSLPPAAVAEVTAPSVPRIAPGSPEVMAESKADERSEGLSSCSETVTSTPGIVAVPTAPRLSLALTKKKKVPVGRTMSVSTAEDSKFCMSVPPSFDQYVLL
mmetsp:Transcript_57848/g.164674  ORF Transcript_57848/g.164674 Transcript_57848/m.164674 type:complete len:351 (-) Transcript_57848:995-2047(-)